MWLKCEGSRPSTHPAAAAFGLNVRLRVEGPQLPGARDSGWRHGRGGMTGGTPITETVTLHVPYRVVKRGGRKEMQLPEGAAQPRRTESTLVKALARAFRWKRMPESGGFATIAGLAERQGIAPSCMARVLRLTLLAHDIVEPSSREAGAGVTLARVLEPSPMECAVRAEDFRDPG